MKDAEYEEALHASEAAKPSSDHAYWAKSSCKHCYGRGVVGQQTKILANGNRLVSNVTCRCAQKKFEQWRDAWIADYRQQKKAKSAILESQATIDNAR